LPLVEKATEPAPVALAASEPVVFEPAPAVEIKTAVAPVASAPLAEALPVVKLPVARAALPTSEPAPVDRPALVAQPVFGSAPAVEIRTAVAPVEPAIEPVVDKAALPVALPVVEPPAAPVAASLASLPTSEPLPVDPPAVFEPAPAVEIKTAVAPAEPATEPVVETAPSPAAAPPLVEALPVVELPAAPVAASVAEASLPIPEPAPVPEPELVAGPEPVVEAAPALEVTPAAAETEPAPVIEPVVEPVAEALPVVAQPPAPVAEAATETAPEPVKASIELHEVPDPLLALAEQIRAVQAARAAALAAPAESAGLVELAGAVGISESTPVAVAEVPVLAAAPVDTLAFAEVTARFKVVTPTALLDPPRYEMALLTPPEPVSLVRSQPFELAPEPQEEAELEAPASVPQPEGPTLPLAPMQKYTPATSRSIQPVPPRAQILSADSGPRITLPGPTLPPALTRLQDANVVTLVGEPTAQRAKEAITPKKSAGGPSWLVSIGVMMLLLAAGLGVVFYLLPHTVADAKPGPTPAQAASTTAPAGPSSPLAKFIEVTGFRVVVDENKKSEVQYLVVNHSAADISNANIFITLRSVKPGQPPLCRFSFKVPSLAPFESKEMSSPIEKTTRGITLPDWQDLRADVQIN